ncbi:MAG: Penicillin-binding protein, 1A family [Candidatus Kuenenbacteria bacterium GW2011_GWA2_42_15]|uniref:Penicillin-binding protein, 1A family n=1 Tax=Candidatus Kuenenbacteria bacterium GW2011_GWA2_42_15 TaxID=1618677 RepID=A0A0G0YUF7_9BACT|nr:MAG: Penicillin-binding protein, 1A family [Candidatus Kuenenbacteria bacterium GW2011_GWA2_42_15]
MPIPAMKIKSPKSWERQSRFSERLIAKRKIEALSGRRSGLASRNSGFFGRRDRGMTVIKKLFRKILKFGIIAAVAVVIFALGALVYYSGRVPTKEEMISASQGSATKIYDRTGEHLLYYFSSDEKRVWVPLDQIPEHVRWAVIATEDDQFYEHHGFDFPALIKAALHEVLGIGPARGGSTITQQLVKNVLLTPEKTYKRKLKELIFSYYLEKRFTKDEILGLYFNVVPYGSTAYGIEAAAGTYFAKKAQALDLAQGAILAAMLQATTYYSPYGSHVDQLMERQHFVLKKMTELGYITAEQEKQAMEEKLEFKPLSQSIVAPHFTLYIKELLAEKYGEAAAEKGGLKIITSLDFEKQEIAEEAIVAGVERNEKKNGAHNASLVSIDAKTGEVLAMVGSRDYFNQEYDGAVNVAMRPRQPGSSFKPIVYAASFLEGFSPETVLFDTVTKYKTETGDDYEPHNYDGTEHGPVSIRQALAGSLNIPAVKTIYTVGIDKVLDLADKMGYTTFGDRSRFGLSLVLGGGEVKLVEHVGAFAIFAQNGVKHDLQYILKVEDKDGKTLEEFKPEENKGEEVLEPQVAKQINSILSDNNARAYIFGEKNYLTLPDRAVAAKTGTTNNFRDGWTIGYTPSIVTGVWVGNNNNTVMKGKADGSIVAAPIWNEYMKKIVAGTLVENFEQPEAKPLPDKPMLNGQAVAETVVKIDKITGRLAADLTPVNLIEERKYRSEPHSILQYVTRGNILGPIPNDPAKDPAYSAFEDGVMRWAEKNNYATKEPLPTEYDNVHTEENKPRIQLSSPADGTVVTNPAISATAEASAKRGIARVEYYFDGELISTQKNYPFDLNDYQLIGIENGEHFLKAVAFDDVENSAEKNVKIYLNLPDEYVNPINWTTPHDGQEFYQEQLPFNLSVRISNDSSFNKVDFYLQKKGEQSTWLGYNEVKGPEANLLLTEAMSGEYNLYVILTGVNGKTVRDKGIWVKVGE